jgi:hypothetical protein
VVKEFEHLLGDYAEPNRFFLELAINAMDQELV